MKNKQIFWAGISLSIAFALLCSFKTKLEEKHFISSKDPFLQTDVSNYVANSLSSYPQMIIPQGQLGYYQNVYVSQVTYEQNNTNLLLGAGVEAYSYNGDFMNIIEDYKLDQLDVGR